ncbi:hypothetical protein DHW03_01055 [Pedobacter yonginense]|jgi:hypothetical protein|uniref:Serine protease n=1 Tax=Pedobacter yonginense TaxID=651869 RepID=A0A317ETL5_9SPHI|nr:hypothetical protein [Pedobacter yonginense]PWS28478.1 hypothetical protein DHW03_01055 [Pedobacter yonginense]
MSITDAEVMVLSSIQVYMGGKENIKPHGFGSGFIVKYLDRRFFITVRHVTDYEGMVTYLETNLPISANGAILKPVGGLCYFDMFTLAEGILPDDFIKFLNDGPRKRLDICFAEIKDDVPLLQLAMNFGAFSVPECSKIDLDLTYTDLPNKEERYGFYGKIKPVYEGMKLHLTPKFNHSLKFHRTNSEFHIFLAPKIIKSADEYEGCSGAPILDSEQRLVGVACAVVTNTKMIYAFPIQKCKELLDTAIQTGML